MMPNLQSVQLETLLCSLREALDKREFAIFTGHFAPFWKFEETPDFTAFATEAAAELLLLAGEFLIEFGKAKAKPELIEKGKNVLTNASDCFWKTGNQDKSFQAQMLLAVGYAYQGSFEEYQIFLQEAERHFCNDRKNPVFLQIQINYLIVELSQNRLAPAARRIKEIQPLIRQVKNEKIKTLFHLQAGIITRLSGNFRESINHFQKAFQNAAKVGSIHHQSLILNCLVNTYHSQMNFPAALTTIDRAIELVADNSGWLPHFLDTKANICLDADQLEEAINYADAAVESFRPIEDYRGFCEALWTQCRILFRLKMPELAMQSFLELCETGKFQVGSRFVEKYVLEFLGDNFYTQKEGLLEKIEEFKETQLRNALIKAGGKRSEAARKLKIPHQYLSKLISKSPRLAADFPNHRKPRNDRRILQKK